MKKRDLLRKLNEGIDHAVIWQKLMQEHDTKSLIGFYEGQIVAFTEVKEWLEEKIEYAICKECGKEFKKTHGAQKFCPPNGQKSSKCQNTYNQRKKRAKSNKKGLTI